jgi:L-histidine N-alpha-methyltransferase
VELGSGNAAKTTLLVEAFLRRQPKLRYTPIDISQSAIEESSVDLLEKYPGLHVDAVAAEYESGMAVLRDRGDATPKLVLWLGSNIGNLDRAEAGAFLGRLRALMSPTDR